MYTCTKCFDIKELFRNLIFIKNFSYWKNLIEKYNNYSIIKWNYYIVKENLYHDIVLHHTTHTLLEKKLGCEKKLFFNTAVLIRDLNPSYMQTNQYPSQFTPCIQQGLIYKV